MSNTPEDTRKDTSEDKGDERGRPAAKVRPHGRFSWIWLIPIVAVGIVAYLAYDTYSQRGPTITITFRTADGLQVDQTLVKHKAVPIGTVDDIDLAPDTSHVIVKVKMHASADKMLTDHARFWVVRPRLAGANITGIETLVSGAYIEMDPGAPGGKKQREWKGLEDPPGRTSDEPGKVFVLKAKRLGSLTTGAPVFYRDVPVGEVLSYDLGDGLGPVTLRVFVRDPYAKFVHPETRFWNASGISLTTGPDGVHLEIESIQAAISGGIAFETPRAAEQQPAAEDDAQFPLYLDKATADVHFFKHVIPFVTYFDQPIQGLAKGSSVLLYGVQVGNVSDVTLVYDAAKKRIAARVALEVQLERVQNKAGDGAQPLALDQVRASFTDTGMKAVLESSNMLTGAKDLELTYAPDVKPSALPLEGEARVLPSQGGGLDGLTAELSDAATKIDKIPFQEIGQNLNGALASLQHLSGQIDENATPALRQLPGLFAQMSDVMNKADGALGQNGYGASSDFQHGLDRTLNEMHDAARSFRVLADYLDRHPEALIRGRSGGAK